MGRVSVRCELQVSLNQSSVPREATQQSDALFRLLVENVEDYAIFAMGPGGEIRTWNDGAARILGYTAAEVVGKHHSLFYPAGEVRRGKPGYVLQAAADEGRFEDEQWRVRQDGTRFWASVVITALRDRDGEIIGFAKVVRDLTERKRAEDDRNQLLNLERRSREETEQVLQRLRAIQTVTEAALAHLDLDALLGELLDRLADALEVDTVAILLLTSDGQWLVPRAARGIEEEVELGIHLPLGRGFAGRIASEQRPIILDDVEHSEVLNPILRQKGVRSLLGVPLLVQGRVLGVVHVGSLHARRFTNDETTFLQIAADRIALAIDHASLYQEATQARLEAESAGQELRLRDEFLSVTAHELRTPITGLRTAVHLIRQPLLKGDQIAPERLLRMAQLIDQEATRLNSLVSQLLDISRLDVGKLALDLSEVDLVQLAHDLAEKVQFSSPGTPITFQGEERLEVRADALRIEQVLINLVNNAIKYSPEGSEVTIEFIRPTADVVQVAVRDRGIGLAPDERERVFERFYQVNSGTRNTGLGLGLYISREIVQRHGGHLWVESPLDGGSRFIAQIPVDPPSDVDPPSGAIG